MSRRSSGSWLTTPAFRHACRHCKVWIPGHFVRCPSCGTAAAGVRFGRLAMKGLALLLISGAAAGIAAAVH